MLYSSFTDFIKVQSSIFPKSIHLFLQSVKWRRPYFLQL